MHLIDTVGLWSLQVFIKELKKIEYQRDDEIVFIIVVTYCVKSKAHLSELADNELLVDTERAVRKKRDEIQVEKHVCLCRWERLFGLW